jgi:hypothetical protein
MAPPEPKATAGPLTDHSDLIQQAAGGSAAAQLGLVELAIAAGKSGCCRQIESLTAAETWARLAAASGGADENWSLVSVLLARAEFEIERCATYNAEWYEGEARRILGLLVLLDDQNAQQALNELAEPQAGEHHGLDIVMLTNLAAAAKGNLTALGSLCDEAFRLLQEGQSDPIEALTAGELYARLASVSGDADHMRRLAGVLLKRAEYEYRDGWAALGDNAVAEAIVLLSILVDSGDRGMATWLSMLVDESSMAAVATAASHRPTILKFIDVKGAC